MLILLNSFYVLPYLEKHPRLKDLQHTLDVWHKGKSLGKMLHKTAKDKEHHDMKQWIPSIVNHFWYSCEISNGDVQTLKDCWFGVVHHVCGEHSWAGSACLHGPNTDSEPKQYLDKKSKAAEALRSVVFDKRFVANFEMYTNFRHTGSIETFNSMLTKGRFPYNCIIRLSEKSSGAFCSELFSLKLRLISIQLLSSQNNFFPNYVPHQNGGHK